MKNNCCLHLASLAENALSVCEMIRSGKYSDCKKLINSSEETRNKCLVFIEKQFITPIDREDITHITLIMHRLNISLCRLADYKCRYYPKKDVTANIEPVMLACKKIRGLFKNGFPKNVEDVLWKNEAYIEPTFQNTYNSLSLMTEYTLFEMIRECYNISAYISDYIIRTVIKNT